MTTEERTIKKIPNSVTWNGAKQEKNEILVGMTEGKKLQGRSRRRWAHNIKMDLREIRWISMDWNDVAQVRDQWWDSYEHYKKSSGSTKRWEISSVAAQLTASQDGLGSAILAAS
jgi:hypothetical protein